MSLLPFGFFWVFWVILAVYLLVYVFFCITFTRAMSQVSPTNRRIAPGLIWLTLIPWLGTIWMIFMTIFAAESFANEQRSRGATDPGKPTMAMGLVFSITGVLGLIPFIGTFLRLISFVFWIIYWVQLGMQRSTLMKMPQMQGDPNYIAPNAPSMHTPPGWRPDQATGTTGTSNAGTAYNIPPPVNHEPQHQPAWKEGLDTTTKYDRYLMGRGINFADIGKAANDFGAQTGSGDTFEEYQYESSAVSGWNILKVDTAMPQENFQRLTYALFQSGADEVMAWGNRRDDAGWSYLLYDHNGMQGRTPNTLFGNFGSGTAFKVDTVQSTVYPDNTPQIGDLTAFLKGRELSENSIRNAEYSPVTVRFNL